ncbi:hypothetical protein GCU56_16265 [Geodermatophilus sabuli]|uniref:Uncharacterized protein n=1 Tax=Geodermatophilus sabuli TaxID=1564158 RepID=A0A7K3W4X2_9ACTN|nr:hypothetical protein [Geodermatophilus sabuli]NEK59413.1 hypothetical protein [Geodermatophilus sabuli]
MSLEQDVAAARSAVDALEQACGPLTRHFGDTVDARRLRVDVARLRDDLGLLCGAVRPRALGPTSPAVYWDDGLDDGLGAPSRTAP